MTALPLAETIPVQLSDLDVFLQNVRPRLAGENVAELVHRYELRPASRLRVGIAALIQNEGVHESRSRISDPDALLPARIVDAVRFRVGHIDLVLVVEGDPAWRAELRPCREMLALLVEELDAIVAAVGHEYAASRIDGDAVQRVELAGRVSGLPPRLDELSVLRELHHAVVAVRLVAVRNENVAIGGHRHRARRREVGG